MSNFIQRKSFFTMLICTGLIYCGSNHKGIISNQGSGENLSLVNSSTYKINSQALTSTETAEQKKTREAQEKAKAEAERLNQKKEEADNKKTTEVSPTLVRPLTPKEIGETAPDYTPIRPGFSGPGPAGENNRLPGRSHAFQSWSTTRSTTIQTNTGGSSASVANTATTSQQGHPSSPSPSNNEPPTNSSDLQNQATDRTLSDPTTPDPVSSNDADLLPKNPFLTKPEIKQIFESAFKAYANDAPSTFQYNKLDEILNTDSISDEEQNYVVGEYLSFLDNRKSKATSKDETLQGLRKLCLDSEVGKILKNILQTKTYKRVDKTIKKECPQLQS